MTEETRRRMNWAPRSLVIVLFVAGALWTLFGLSGPTLESSLSRQAVYSRQASGSPRLVAVDPLPNSKESMCEWAPISAHSTRKVVFQQEKTSAGASAVVAPSVDADRAPVRVIRDTYPTYSAIALNTRTDEVFLQDENLFGISVFNRLDNTPSGAAFTEPKRTLRGRLTKMEFNCGLYVDPISGDIYSVNNDTTDLLVIFPAGAEGNISPSRELVVPHGTYGIAVNETAQEMYLTVEHDNSIVVYPKIAKGNDPRLRTIEGPKTQLEDPHGIALDTKNGLLFVSNHGNSRVGGNDGYGKFEPPSITVYSLQSYGDVAPLRVIEGPRTQLNWPAHLWVDEPRGELYVANDSGDSILAFRTTDSGDVAPTREIRGPKTQIKNPTGVFLDSKNDELWVSNMGNHSATVFPRTANGNVAPKRVIRSAPLGKLALAIGNPGAVEYDSKRDEILVPN